MFGRKMFSFTRYQTCVIRNQSNELEWLDDIVSEQDERLAQAEWDLAEMRRFTAAQIDWSTQELIDTRMYYREQIALFVDKLAEVDQELEIVSRAVVNQEQLLMDYETVAMIVEVVHGVDCAEILARVQSDLIEPDAADYLPWEVTQELLMANELLAWVDNFDDDFTPIEGGMTAAEIREEALATIADHQDSDITALAEAVGVMVG